MASEAQWIDRETVAWRVGWTEGREFQLWSTVDGVRMSRKKMFFSSARAIRELGYAPRPARQAIADAVAWFKAKGYLQ